MRHVLAFVGAGAVGFAAVSLGLGRHSASTPGPEPGKPGLQESPPRSRVGPDEARRNRTQAFETRPVELEGRLEELRVEDPHAASLVREAAGIAFVRLLASAWREHQGGARAEPLACLDGGANVGASFVALLDVDAAAESLTVSNLRVVEPALPASARRCVEDWFRGEGVVLAEELDGPFPEVAAAFERPVPVRLGAYFEAHAAELERWTQPQVVADGE